MIRALLRMQVRAGREADFERAWHSVATEARHAAGNRQQALLRDPQEPGVYLVASDWDSADHFRAFERSPEQDVLTAPLRALREAADLTVLEVVALF